jgi:acetylornithine deacetylase/succinyl-diaminopimelate desuccinylase-like protein
MSPKVWFCCVLLSFHALRAQEHVDHHVRSYIAENEHRILRELVDLLAIPNVAADRENIRRNAALLMEMMNRRGISAQLIEPPGGNGSPTVYGELRTPGATRTLMLYAHYDGQPTDPSKWIDSEPWKPAIRTDAIEAGGTIIPFPPPDTRIDGNWRVYARSASDDKSPIVAMLTAIDALRSATIPLRVNLKFYFDGEEEAGSPTMESVLLANKDLLTADAWIICDGPVHQNGQKLVYFGVRGITTAEITVYGANRDLHSGHYGNWAPNPAMMLAQLLASMKEVNGRVLIEGFYDDTEPLGELERRALAEAPDYDEQLKRELGIGWTEGEEKSLVELINLPSLTVNGISSAYVGAQARTIIPSTATARVDMRLVSGNDPARQLERLKTHIRKQGFHVTDREPDATMRLQHPRIASVTSRGGYKALRTRMDLPVSMLVVDALQWVSERSVVRMPTLGGSVPMSFIPEIFGVPVIGVPIVNYDNNQHSENENVRLQNVWDGIVIYAALMVIR